VNGPLLLQNDGSIICTAQEGGTFSVGGTIFKLKPPAQKGAPWTAKVLYDFGANGGLYLPQSGVIKAPGGGLYGTAFAGGGGFGGGVFLFAP
jgi:hypothetical protein